jgi:hypothetical protein
MKLSSIGSRGLVVFLSNQDRFRYVTEGTWRQNSNILTAPTPNTTKLQALGAAVAPVRDATSTTFVNLDALANLAKETVPGTRYPPNPPPIPPTTGNFSVVVYETLTGASAGQYYMVPSALFAQLAAGAEGDAAVLVRRGAVLAAIPTNSIPSGSFCVLVNIAGIKP